MIATHREMPWKEMRRMIPRPRPVGSGGAWEIICYSCGVAFVWPDRRPKHCPACARLPVKAQAIRAREYWQLRFFRMEKGLGDEQGEIRAS